MPVVDGAKNTNLSLISIKNIMDFTVLDNIFDSQWRSSQQGVASMVDSVDNGFANMIVRQNQTQVDIQNQQMRLSSKPLDICDSISVSAALNDLVCDALESMASDTQDYSERLTQPYQVAHDVDSYKISDISTVAVSTAPKVQVNQAVTKQTEILEEQVFKTTVFATLDSIKLDRENIINPLTNSALDDFSPEEVQKIQEEYSKSQLYRKMLVMRAKMLSASMTDYKHQLQQEMILALSLLSKNNNAQ